MTDTQSRLERALSEIRRLAHERPLWPVAVLCDGCGIAQPFNPMPEEADLAAALIALRWSLENGHRCPGCSRGR